MVGVARQKIEPKFPALKNIATSQMQLQQNKAKDGSCSCIYSIVPAENTACRKSTDQQTADLIAAFVDSIESIFVPEASLLQS
jgi:hypothetical protein